MQVLTGLDGIGWSWRQGGGGEDRGEALHVVKSAIGRDGQCGLAINPLIEAMIVGRVWAE